MTKVIRKQGVAEVFRGSTPDKQSISIFCSARVVIPSRT